jgi:hypothetical protein
MMRLRFVCVLSVVAIGAMLAIPASPAAAATIKECKAAYAAHKDEAKAAGQSAKAYIASCRGAPDVAGSGAATAAPPTTAARPRSAGDKIGKACEADYATNKAAVTDRGESKADFIASCRAAMEASQQTTTPEPAASAPESASK